MKHIKTTLQCLFFIPLLSLATQVFSQGGPCDTGGPGCQNGGGDYIMTSENDTVDTKAPFHLQIGVGVKATGKVDTSYNGTATLIKILGPGNLSGSLSQNFHAFADFQNLELDSVGNYEIEVEISGIGKDTLKIYARPNAGNNGMIDFCGGSPGCQSGGGDEIFYHINDTIQIGSPTPFFIGVKNKSTGKIDTTYNVSSANISATLASDTLFFNGNPTSNIMAGPFNGLTEIVNFAVVSQNPTISLIIDINGIGKDTIMVHLANSNGNGGNGGGNQGGGNCLKSTSGDRVNLGLYGGSSLDLSYSLTGRLFAAIETPASLFISDDTAKTWYPAFPKDSLEYDCGRGWGGRATRVLTNKHNWVAVQTMQSAGTLTSAVFNSHDGDTGHWSTAMDGFIDQQIGGGNKNVSVKCIDLTDHYMYIGVQGKIYRKNSAGLDTANIVDFKNITSISDDSYPMAIAAANDASGYPMYILVDSINSPNTNSALLYKFDGSTATQLTSPSGTSGFCNVFLSNAYSNTDTVYVNANSGGNKGSYVSYDGGNSWNTIWAPTGTNALSDVDYSPTIGTSLIIPGTAVSFDKGASWDSLQLVTNGMAVHPMNDKLIVGTKGRGVVVSTNGASGPFNTARNFGLEAVKIKQIARSSGKGVFYIATAAGLAYTTAYNNNSVANFDKWNAPHGEFPIPNAGDDAGVSSVAINPSDSTHVIIGYSNGFSVTTSGPAGFNNIKPSSWDVGQQDHVVHDIKFINSSVVLAVTGGGNQNQSAAGNIYRSADGGQNWTQVTTSGFAQGNSIAVYSDATDTVIYIGCGLEQGNDPLDKGALWKSNDLGLSWSKVNAGPSNLSGSVTDLPILDLAVKSTSKDTLYLVAGSNLDHAFVYSHDGGITYQNVDISGEGAFSSVMLNQNDEDTVYVAIRRELYLYDAKNDSSILVFRGLPGELIPDLTWGSVLAGTSTGAYKMELDLSPVVTSAEESFKIANNEINLYPNPSAGIIHISINQNIDQACNIQVLTLMGQIVANTSMSNLLANQLVTLDLSTLAQGSYYIVISSGEKRMTARLVLSE